MSNQIAMEIQLHWEHLMNLTRDHQTILLTGESVSKKREELHEYFEQTWRLYESLFEVIRWHRALTTKGDDFKLNNNHAPFYARLIMSKEADLEEFFNIREQKI